MSTSTTTQPTGLVADVLKAFDDLNGSQPLAYSLHRRMGDRSRAGLIYSVVKPQSPRGPRKNLRTSFALFIPAGRTPRGRLRLNRSWARTSGAEVRPEPQTISDQFRQRILLRYYRVSISNDQGVSVYGRYCV